MLKYRLMAPGPTPVPPSVQRAMAQPILHHRSSAFRALFKEIRAGLKWVFQTQHEVLSLACTGTAALEGAVCNFLSYGDKAIFLNSGKFGQRWGAILRAYGCQAIEISVPLGEAVEPAQVEEALRAHPDAKAVCIQACETSTAVAHPVQAVAALCAQYPEALCMVDAMTGIGVMDIAQDRDGIDVLIGGSQKALMLPPGLAFVGISPRAWRHAERSNLPKYYLDFTVARQSAVDRNQTPWTSAVTLIMGLKEVLRLLDAEGLEAVFERHRRLARACRAGVQALDCRLSAPRAPADGLTGAYPPAGVDVFTLLDTLRDTYGIHTVAGSASEGRCFRISHMGWCDETDVLSFLSALQGACQQLQPSRFPSPSAGTHPHAPLGPVEAALNALQNPSPSGLS